MPLLRIAWAFSFMSLAFLLIAFMRLQEWGIECFSVFIGVYGVITVLHLMTELRLATKNHHYIRALPQDTSHHTVGISVVGWNEHPPYFRDCLNSLKNISYPKSLCRIFAVIDGAGGEDGVADMRDVFREVFPDGKMLTLDFLPAEQGSAARFSRVCKEVQETNAPICIMQPHRGKREAMYTAMRCISAVECEYAMLTDSDTIIDEHALNRLMDVMVAAPETGAVTGNVGIFNQDSLLARLSSQRYWMAFNLERAAQSCYGGVGCVSGPLGLYKVSLLDKILDKWVNQHFIGNKCTYGDDRHLTNLILSLGASVRYTQLAHCLTETPLKFDRWVVQQTRWSKSYWREFLYNLRWAHKHHPWMWWELIYKTLFPILLACMVVAIISQQRMDTLFLMMVMVLVGGLLRMWFASNLTGWQHYSCFWMYGLPYMCGILPGKMWALITLFDTAWGTSRKLHHASPIYVYGWCMMLLVGIIGALMKTFDFCCSSSSVHLLAYFLSDQTGQLTLMFGTFIVTIAVVKIYIMLRRN